MLIYCTYCSAEKHPSKKPIAAIDLYKSTRIREVYQMASKANLPFFVFSGKHGLIASHQPVAWYDHLLQKEASSAHAEFLAKQIQSFNISAIHFFSNFPENDPNLHTYIDCITAACKSCNIPIQVSTQAFKD
jgi:hypothetical protein